tara:strand:+ start:2349 stop:3809 length:1461 start_codon:yes stop_codon:yes gene_type:complete
MKLSRLATKVENLANAKILCIGDVMLDRFVYGLVERTSPEAPVPVLNINEEKKMLGGAGNVAHNIVSLGAKVTLVSVVGDDLVGRELTTMVGQEKLIEPYLLVESGRKSTQKTRFVAGNQQLLRADNETIHQISESVSENLLRIAHDLIPDSDVLVISDYAKGLINQEVSESLINAANLANIKIIVDPKGPDFKKYKNCQIITPNRHELSIATDLKTDSSTEIIDAARKLMESFDIDHTLVTRSAEGISLISRNGCVEHLPADAREVYDVSGAGDTVVASLSAALGAGIDLKESAALANAAAGVAVGKTGTATTYTSDLLHALRSQDLNNTEAKVVTHGTAQKSLDIWRMNDEIIGFTNGCFDLLHPGHISLLRQAKANCDRLIVGLNSDTSVKRLKGEDRPIQGEDARAQVLASLEIVDLVIIFAEDTPISLLKEILPDILVKGSDYTLDEVIGKDIVLQNGGKIFLADIEPGHSTSETINRIRD